MIKTSLGALRYNNKMDRIFENAKKLKEANYLEACKISDHLLTTGQQFCYIEDGRIIDREHCARVIDDYNTL